MKKPILARAMEKLKQSLSNKDEGLPEEPQTYIERRRHQRFDLGSMSSVFVDVGNGQRTQILDLSYGGFSATLPSDLVPQQSKSYSMLLQVLDQTCEIEVAITHVGKSSFGCCFVHGTAETLIFLRPIIERMRCGASCSEIDKSIIKEEWKGKEWIVLRGDGPTDVVIRSSDIHSAFVEGQLTYRDGDKYVTFQHQNGKSRVCTSIDNTGMAARMTGMAQPDADQLRRALHVLLGAYSQFRCNPLKEWIETELKKLNLAPNGEARVS